MKWELSKEYFSDYGALVDIYFEPMNHESWKRLFVWVSHNPVESSVNCYISSTDQNIDYIPDNVDELINEKGFYCFISLLFNGITLFLRFYDIDELECDVSPKEIDNEEKLDSLISMLNEIRNIVGVDKYIMCPENYKDGAFNTNGVFNNEGGI